MPVAGAFFLGGMGWAAGGTLATTYAGAYALGGGVLGSIAVRLATSVALTALTAALSGPQAGPQQAGIRGGSTARGDVNPDSFILGRYATAGSHVCPPYTHGKRDNNTPNPYLQYVIHLGGAPGQKLAGMTVDGRACSIEGPEYVWDPMNPMNTRYRHYSSNEEKQRFYGRRVEINGLDSTRCWVRYHDGTQTEVDGPLHYAYRGRSRPWSEDMIGTGICYAVVTFQMKESAFTGFPEAKFILEGKGLYDIRKDTTAGGDGPHRWDDPATHEGSENPAVQIYNLLRGIRLPGGAVYGGRARADQLPVANWMAAMDACDAPVELAEGGTEPAWRTSYEVKLSDEPAAVIEELCKAASIQLAEDGGTWRIRVGGPGVPVAHITDLDIISTADQSLEMFPGVDETHNGVSISFPDPGSAWQAAEAPLHVRSDYEAQDGGKQLVADLAVSAAPYPAQNQRLARAYVEEERRFRRHVLTLPPDYGALEVLDAIAWTSDRNGYDTKIFEISSAATDPVTQLVTVAVRERDPEDYEWEPSLELPFTSQPIVWGEAPLAEPAGFGLRGLALVDPEGVARRAALELSWSTVDLDGLTAIQWEYRLKGGDQILRGNTTDVIAGIARIVEGVLPGQTYEVQAQVVARGFEPVWTGWMEATTPPVQGVEIADLSPEVQALINQAHDGSEWVNAATEAANASDVARQQSQAARDEAKRQADAAVLAKGGAEAASGRAVVAEESAGRSASSAAENARLSAEAKDAAGRSATAAATSDSSAAASKKGADEAASAASASKAAAETARGAAETARTAAATSAGNAKTSETNAATSEKNAATSRTDAGKSATAASGSASSAATSAGEAGEKATAASTLANKADTARASAETAARSAATAEEGAKGASASALEYRDASARMTGGGVSKNPTFNDWSGAVPTGYRFYTNEGTVTKIAGAAARYVNAMEVTTANPPTIGYPGVRLLSSDNAGPVNPTMIRVRLEIERRAGTYANAQIRVTWDGDTPKTAVVHLRDEIPVSAQEGVVFPVDVLVERPAGHVLGATTANLRVDLWAANGAGDAYLKCRLHRFDFEAVNANAVASIAQKAKATVDGIASSTIGLRAKAGEEEALLELVALSNPQGSASAFRIRADQIKLEGEVDAETMIVGQMSSEHLVVNSRLTLEEDAALNYGKGSLTDSRDGIFFGKEGDTGFGLSVSRTANDRRQSIDLTKNRFRLLNARHAVTASSFPIALSWSSSITKRALPAGVREIELKGVGGGGGGRNDAGANDGTATIVRLYDGPTLKYTLTCPGGRGGKNDKRPAHHTSAGRAEPSYYTNNDDGAERYDDCNVPGGGGGGGREGRTKQDDDIYEGGRAAPLISSGTIDVTGWANPMIEVVLGVGGAGIKDEVGQSGHGGPGFAEASYTTYVELPADVVPLQPTARGTFSKPSSGANLSFPNLGAGFWVLDTNGGNDLGLNTVTIAPDTTIWLGHPINASFFSSQTPTYSPADSTRTIHYKFYSMGSWG